jgi:hypothetical protein
MLAGIIAIACTAAFLTVGGCGRMIDKDRIRIAKIGDKYITRGDLFRLLREMSDTQRPKVNSRGDYLRLLNQHIDTMIKLPLGQKLKAEGKIDVPREAAREEFFKDSGDEGDQLRTMWTMEIPKNGETTPLMKEYDLTPEKLQFQKDNIDEETDRMVAKMLGEQAVQYLAVQAMKEGKIKITDEEIEREYRFAGDSLHTFEEITFRAVRFPAALPDAAAQASHVRALINGGQSFETLVDAYLLKGQQDKMQFVIESGIQNNPSLQRFRGFWNVAAGANEGDVLGPVYLPEYQQMAVGKDGKTKSVVMPDAYLVLKVLQHKPEHTLTVEEAKPALAAPLIVGKEMELLRKDNGVEVYQDQLPEPGQMGPGELGI